MNVIFVEPNFPRNQREFVRALKQVGATVIGVGESSREALDSQLQDWLFDYIQVPSVCDEGALTRAVRFVQSKLWVDRLEATVEAHIMPVARVREACTIPGVSVQAAFLCRDKPAMKEHLRKHGIPCAQSIGSGDAAEILDFAHRVGYPLIVKPRSGAGASGTSRVNNDDELRRALVESHIGRGGEVAVEEFIEGHEAFYDTLSVDGNVVHDFVSHYYPNVLEAMRTRWISPQFIATNRVDSAEDYREVKELGQRVIKALGIGTAATHMEWFYGPKGLRFSEIGVRPPGVRAWDLYNAGNDLDLYLEWSSAIVHGQPTRKASRRFSAGIIALRPERDGTIRSYDGLGEIQQRYGEWIIDYHLPDAGTPTQPVEAGYMANAWIRLKHPDYDQLRSMMDDVGRTVKTRCHG
jgi:formate-dependent phosphoribosylglycinamide formyltransferase (GAR transformylase)